MGLQRRFHHTSSPRLTTKHKSCIPVHLCHLSERIHLSTHVDSHVLHILCNSASLLPLQQHCAASCCRQRSPLGCPRPALASGHPFCERSLQCTVKAQPSSGQHCKHHTPYRLMVSGSGTSVPHSIESWSMVSALCISMPHSIEPIRTRHLEQYLALLYLAPPSVSALAVLIPIPASIILQHDLAPSHAWPKQALP